jgi:putative intracellular protease/amidase
MRNQEGLTLRQIDNQQQPGRPHETITVAVLLFDGAEIIDYAGPWEVFGQARFNVFSVAETTEPMTAVFGQKIRADYSFANSPAANVLLVPGGSGARKAVDNPAIVKWVQQNAKTSKYVMSVCTGAFILAKAGLLDGLSATTVNGAIDRLAQVAAKTHVVSNQRYVDNGKVITTAGLSSGIDGALHLVSKIKGKGTAQATALYLEYQWDPDGKFVRAALADRYFPRFDNFDGELVFTEGDRDRWQFQVLITKPDSVAAIADLISKSVTAKTPHACGSVTLISNATVTRSKNEIAWKFTDENGSDWNGSASVEPSNQQGKFVLTVNLSRQSI